MQQKAEFRILYRAYQRAWRRFAMQVDLWQSLEAESIAAQEAEAAVEQAEVLYRQSRNRLVDHMIFECCSGTRGQGTRSCRDYKCLLNAGEFQLRE